MKPKFSANLLTYLHWRGDLSFSAAPFCPVDNLIFSCLAYLNWDVSAMQASPQQAVPLKEAAAGWMLQYAHLDQNSHYKLLTAAASSTRFGNVRLFRHTNQFHAEQEKQFSATTFLIDEQTLYVAFRGTDNTLIGWKEDFNMAFQKEVPSQTAAALYLRSVLALDFPQVIVGGHSKGGNLAVFAAIQTQPEYDDKLKAVYNNDGPGFSSDILQSTAYEHLKDRVHTYIPQESIVGMLLEHDEDYHVIYSTQKGFLQHDPYSWCVDRADWFYRHAVTKESKLLDTSLKNWIAGMQPAERERLVDSIFDVLNNTNATTVRDLKNGGSETISNVLHAWKDTPLETRRFMQKMLLKLVYHISLSQG